MYQRIMISIILITVSRVARDRQTEKYLWLPKKVLTFSTSCSAPYFRSSLYNPRGVQDLTGT